MAMYRLSAKHASGGGAKAHYQYINREGKFKKKDDNDLCVSETHNLPTWTKSPRVFWGECSKAEDGFEKIELALPNELNRDEQVDLVRKYCNQEFGDKYTYTFAIHTPKGALSKEENPHAHIMFSEREINPDRPEPSKADYFKKSRTRKDGTVSGGYKKNYKFYGRHREENGEKWIINTRERWADIQNDKFKELGLNVEVDHRSYKERGIDMPAQVHLGPSVTQAVKEGRGEDNELYQYNESIKRMQEYSRLPSVEELEQELTKHNQALRMERAVLESDISDLMAEDMARQQEATKEQDEQYFRQTIAAEYEEGLYKYQGGTLWEIKPHTTTLGTVALTSQERMNVILETDRYKQLKAERLQEQKKMNSKIASDYEQGLYQLVKEAGGNRPLLFEKEMGTTAHGVVVLNDERLTLIKQTDRYKAEQQAEQAKQQAEQEQPNSLAIATEFGYDKTESVAVEPDEYDVKMANRYIEQLKQGRDDFKVNHEEMLEIWKSNQPKDIQEYFGLSNDAHRLYTINKMRLDGSFVKLSEENQKALNQVTQSLRYDKDREVDMALLELKLNKKGVDTKELDVLASTNYQKIGQLKHSNDSSDIKVIIKEHKKGESTRKRRQEKRIAKMTERNRTQEQNYTNDKNRGHSR